MRTALLGGLMMWVVGCGSATTSRQDVFFDGGAYARTCVHDMECVAAKLADVCNECACPDTAINTSSHAQYEADVAAAKCVHDPMGPVCAACQIQVSCAAGLCTATMR